MNRRFRLDSLLAIRQMLEEQQKRKVQACRSSLDISAGALSVAERWLAAWPFCACSSELVGAEIAFARDCSDAVKVAEQKQKEKHRKLSEQLAREIESLQQAHRNVETISTLKDQHLLELALDRRRSQQTALDEAFRMCKRPTSELKDETNPAD